MEFLKKTHKTLTKYLDWPIPYWVSPLGMFILSGLFWLYSQAYDFAMPSTIHWVLDKIVFLGGILAAALIAQYIFNDNARNRENRERRLRNGEELLAELITTDNHIKKFYDLRSFDATDESISIIYKFAYLKSISLLYFPELITDLEEFISAFNQLSDEAHKKSHEFVRASLRGDGLEGVKGDLLEHINKQSPAIRDICDELSITNLNESSLKVLRGLIQLQKNIENN